MVFSTHGLESIQHLGMDRPDEEFGYRFKPSSEQIDIPVEEYGQMVVTPDFVEKQIATIRPRKRRTLMADSFFSQIFS